MAKEWLTKNFARYNPGLVIYELRTREVKSGSKWKSTRSELIKLTAQQYVHSAGDDTQRFFGARRTGKYFPFGYYPGSFTAISPDKKERDVSLYYSEDQLNALRFKIKPDTKIDPKIRRKL